MNLYPIVLSQSGIVGFIDSLYRQYSSTGISDSAVVQIEKSFSGIESRGELRVSREDPLYFSLVLRVAPYEAQDDPLDIEIRSEKELFLIKA
jgi:hypothetical protein